MFIVCATKTALNNHGYVNSCSLVGGGRVVAHVYIEKEEDDRGAGQST